MSIEDEVNEHMPDQLDRAAVITDRYNRECLDKIQIAARPEQVCVDGVWPTTECLECGEDLGMRLQLGKVLCIRCQEIKERRNAGFAF